MTISLDYFGRALNHQKITPGNTITSVSANCYNYKRWKLNFDAGTDEIVAGDWIIGATSGAVGKVVSIYDDGTGTWAGDDVVGYLIIDSMVGTWTDNEKLKVAADAAMADVNGPAAPVSDDYDYKGVQAKAMLINIYANTALCSWTGGKPDQTALIGQPMVANSSYVLTDINDIKNFKCVDYTSGSASQVQLTFYF